MPVLSHLHQLFHADTCDAYIHTLRWKDRPLHCPRYQSPNTGPWGTYHYRPGLKRGFDHRVGHFWPRSMTAEPFFLRYLGAFASH